MKTALKFVGIGRARAGNCRSPQKLWSAIQIFIKYDIDLDYLVNVLRRSAEIIAKHELKNDIEREKISDTTVGKLEKRK